MSMHKACCKKEDRPIKFPLWQMVHQEKEAAVAPEDEYKNDRFNCLTSRVRACYLRNLEKVLMNNYEMCSNEERSEFPYSKESILKAAEQLECRALCSCMVVILYQRAMMRLTSDIKKHTKQLRLYRRLQEIVNSAWNDKEIQTSREDFLTDAVTQTDAYEIAVIKSEPPEKPMIEASCSPEPQPVPKPMVEEASCSPEPQPVPKPMIEASCSPEPQPIPVLVSGVAMTKTFSESSTSHDKENLMPTKEKAYYKRYTKDLFKEPKVNSPPEKPCLRVKSLSSLQEPFIKNGAMPLEIIDEDISKPVVTNDAMTLEMIDECMSIPVVTNMTLENIDEDLSKPAVTNGAMPLENLDERLSNPAVTNGAMPLENLDERLSKPAVTNGTIPLENIDERLAIPVVTNGTVPLENIDKRLAIPVVRNGAVPLENIDGRTCKPAVRNGAMPLDNIDGRTCKPAVRNGAMPLDNIDGRTCKPAVRNGAMPLDNIDGRTCKPAVRNGAMPLDNIDGRTCKPAVRNGSMPLDNIDGRTCKPAVRNGSMPLDNIDGRTCKPAVRNGAMPLEARDQHTSKRAIVRKGTMPLVVIDQHISKPVVRNGTMPLEEHISKQENVEEAVPDIPLPPSPALPTSPTVEEDKVSDEASSPRMSIEERLALVFNIPTETAAQASTPSERRAGGRRMSIEERLEAVFRGETINDEDVQSEEGAEQANESMETLKNEEHVVAPPRLKLKLIELFGHESDGEEEDNEPPYKDKIARWVVECLMPYYRLKLIANRLLFKRLARHIADTVMLSKPLPDKSDVDDCVTEFFSNHSCVTSKRDII